MFFSQCGGGRCGEGGGGERVRRFDCIIVVDSWELDNSEVPSNAMPLVLLQQPKLKHPGQTTRRCGGTPPQLKWINLVRLGTNIVQGSRLMDLMGCVRDRPLKPMEPWLCQGPRYYQILMEHLRIRNQISELALSHARRGMTLLNPQRKGLLVSIGLQVKKFRLHRRIGIFTHSNDRQTKGAVIPIARYIHVNLFGEAPGIIDH